MRGLAPARDLEQLVEAGVPEQRIGLRGNHHVGAGGAQQLRIGLAGLAAQGHDGRRPRVGVFAELADRARRVRQAPVDHDEAGDQRPHGLDPGGEVRGEGPLDVGAPEDGSAQVVAQVRRGDDEDLGHGGNVSAQSSKCRGR